MTLLASWRAVRGRRVLRGLDARERLAAPRARVRVLGGGARCRRPPSPSSLRCASRRARCAAGSAGTCRRSTRGVRAGRARRAGAARRGRDGARPTGPAGAAALGLAAVAFVVAVDAASRCTCAPRGTARCASARATSRSTCRSTSRSRPPARRSPPCGRSTRGSRRSSRARSRSCPARCSSRRCATSRRRTRRPALFNFEHLRETLDDALRTANRREDPVAVVMVDLDHLRAINNRFGHLAGDQAILRVAGPRPRGAGPRDRRAVRRRGVLPAPPGLDGRAGRGADRRRPRGGAGPRLGAATARRCAARSAPASPRSRRTPRTPSPSWPPSTRRCTTPRPAGATGPPRARRRRSRRSRRSPRPRPRRRRRMPAAEPVPAPGRPAARRGRAGRGGRARDDEPPAAATSRRSWAPCCSLIAALVLSGPISARTPLFLLVLLVAAVVLLDVVRIDLFEGLNLSAASVPTLALACAFGPVGPIAAEVAIAVVRMARGEPRLKWSFDLGALGLAGTAAALVFAVMPTETPLQSIFAGIPAALAYYLVNTCADGARHRARRGPPPGRRLARGHGVAVGALRRLRRHRRRARRDVRAARAGHRAALRAAGRDAVARPARLRAPLAGERRRAAPPPRRPRAREPPPAPPARREARPRRARPRVVPVDDHLAGAHDRGEGPVHPRPRRARREGHDAAGRRARSVRRCSAAPPRSGRRSTTSARSACRTRSSSSRPG